MWCYYAGKVSLLDRMEPEPVYRPLPSGRFRPGYPGQLRHHVAQWNFHRLWGTVAHRCANTVTNLFPLYFTPTRCTSYLISFVAEIWLCLRGSVCDMHFKITFQENTLYWCDARTDKIERINLETGESREIVLSVANVDLFSVAVFGPYIYWSDR